MGSTIDESTIENRNSERLAAWKGRSRLTRVRSGAFYLSLLTAGVLAALFLPELLATLVTGWTADAGAELGIHRLHIMGIAAVVTVFLLGLFAQVSRPRTRVASMWGAFLVILTVSLGTVGFGVGRPEEVLPFLLLTSIALVAHPAGRRLFRRGDSYSPALLGLLAVAAIPLVAFAATQLSLSTSAIDPHALDGHYVMMLGLATAPIAYGLFAALGFAGWRLASWLAALPMGYYGFLSVSFPAQAGSTGLLWGVAAILWAIAFVAVAESARRGGSMLIRRPNRRVEPDR